MRAPSLALPRPRRTPPRPRRDLFVPAWPGLGTEVLARESAETDGLPFPLSARGTVWFHRGGAALYHLVRTLRLGPGATILVPDYHGGSEIAALRAAGARLIFYRVDRWMQPDLDQIERLSPGARCLYVIHYLGWPQPMRPIQDLCRERGLFLIEDCALSFLSTTDDGPLGRFGDFALFCPYKTLPVPDGGLLVQNTLRLDGIEAAPHLEPAFSTLLGRTADLVIQRVVGRSRRTGTALLAVRRGAGRLARRLPSRRPHAPGGAFDTHDTNDRAGWISRALLARFDYTSVIQRRRANFLRLKERLEGRVPFPRPDLPDGVCPLFFPILVPDKEAAARALRRRGVEAVEFWNQGDQVGSLAEGAEARHLRRHLLEIPIHQDMSPEAVEFAADRVLEVV
jgi:dTDP-4-amino-4,6-dideoxygalactose transaminase